MTVATQPYTGTFVADTAHSSFMFTVTHMKIARFSATFHDFDGRVVADEQGAQLEGAARVESISITKPPEFRETVVNGAEFFDAQNYPEITVRSNDLQFNVDGTVVARGELTVKDVTRAVTATGTYQPIVEDPYGALRCAIELSATIDRRDWNLNWQAPLPKGGDVLGWDVELTAHLELVKES